jgi:preprotein translocase subunit YajC
VSQGILILAQAGGGGSNPLGMLAFFGLMLGVMYFVMIRPQQKQMQQHRALLASLKKGDEVVTQGGLLGKIYAISDKLVTLEISNGVRIRVLKSSVQSLMAGEEAAAQKADSKAEQKEEK